METIYKVCLLQGTNEMGQYLFKLLSLGIGDFDSYAEAQDYINNVQGYQGAQFVILEVFRKL
jgi:hypothetical protein